MISLSREEKIIFISNLSVMLASGIPLFDAIVSMIETAKGNKKKFLESIKRDLNSGQTFSYSLHKFPDTFDAMAIHIIKSAEESGTLTTALKDYTKNLRKDAEFLQKVQGALLYPVLVFFVFLAVLLLMLLFVVPKIGEVFSHLPVVLPLPTKILLSVSHILTTYTIFVISGMLLFFATLWFIYSRNKRLFLNAFFSLPFFKNLSLTIDLSRFTRTMSLLLGAGVPIVDSLSIAKEVVFRKDVEQTILHTKNAVAGGKNVSEGLQNKKQIIPSMMIRMVESAEKSGALQKTMQDLSEHFENDTTNNLRAITVLVEPLVLLFVATLVGLMMFAVVAPIYNLIGQLSTSGTQ